MTTNKKNKKMTTREMISVMQAYDRGEEIEARFYREATWATTTIPDWDWELYEYRVNPKKSRVKFKVGDIVVRRNLDGFAADVHANSRILRISEVTDKFYRVFNLAGDFFDVRDIGSFNKEYIDAGDVLWYWEFKMSDGWHISQTRMTRAQARAFVGDSVEIAPLYALGFRIKES